MQHVNFEEISNLIHRNQTEYVNLSHRNLYDSHIIELIPILSARNRIVNLDLSNNNITDFGAMLLIAALKNTNVLNICQNNLSENIHDSIKSNVWSHDMEIHITVHHLAEPLKIELSSSTKKGKLDFNALNKHFNEYLESLYHDPKSAKRYMSNFLMLCVSYWGSSYIKAQSFDQIVARKKIPGSHHDNKRAEDIYHYLVCAVDYACQIERIIKVYKSYILAGNSLVEELLLKELAEIMISVQDSNLDTMDAYNANDLISDIFDFFILRFNMEIDNSFFFGTSNVWNIFLNDIRRFFIDHIRVAVSNTTEADSDKTIEFLKEAKTRTIFTLHRHKTFRFLSIFSNFLAGRTQALIEIDKTILELENDPDAKLNRLQVAWENSKNIAYQQSRLYRPQPIDSFLQLLSAIRLHDKARVAELLCLSKHIHMNNVDSDGWGLIHHWAASSKVDKEIYCFLSVGLRTVFYDIIAKTGWNAIFVLINNNTGPNIDKAEKLRLLLNEKLDTAVTDKVAGKTALHYAVETDQDLLVKALCEYNMDMVNIEDSSGKTALEYAKSGSSTQNILLHHGAISGEGVYVDLMQEVDSLLPETSYMNSNN